MSQRSVYYFHFTMVANLKIMGNNNKFAKVLKTPNFQMVQTPIHEGLSKIIVKPIKDLQ